MDLPVGFARDIHPAEVATVVFRVSPPQQQLTTWLSCGISAKKDKSPSSGGKVGMHGGVFLKTNWGLWR